MDTEPRSFEEKDREILRLLAEEAMEKLVLGIGGLEGVVPG